MIRAWRFLTLLLAALGLGLGLAHVLELSPKMAYDAELYMAVTSTLYRLYGLVGGPIQVGALLAAIVLTIHWTGSLPLRHSRRRSPSIWPNRNSGSVRCGTATMPAPFPIRGPFG